MRRASAAFEKVSTGLVAALGLVGLASCEACGAKGEAVAEDGSDPDRPSEVTASRESQTDGSSGSGTQGTQGSEEACPHKVIEHPGLTILTEADWEALRGVTHLRSYATLWFPVTDLGPLECLEEIEGGFYANYQTFDSLEPLRRLRRAGDLDLQSPNVTSLAPLANLVQVGRLTLDFPGVTSLEGLSALEQADVLQLAYFGITNLEGLKSYQGQDAFTNLDALRVDRGGSLRSATGLLINANFNLPYCEAWGLVDAIRSAGGSLEGGAIIENCLEDECMTRWEP
jgi:hypothetical protein